MNGYLSEFEKWVNSGKPLSDLEDSLLKYYNPQRAKWIAVTETTRSFAMGNLNSWKAGGLVQGMRWHTAEDDIVCPICSPLAGKLVSLEKGFSHEDLDQDIPHPPAHVMCRCWLQPVLVLPDNIGTEVPGYDPFDFDAALDEMAGIDHLDEIFGEREFRYRDPWSDAISDYKGENYWDVNGILRGNHDIKDPKRIEKMRKEARLIDEALENAPALEKDIVGYRGIRKTGWSEFVDDPEYLIGQTIEDAAFASTSLNPEISGWEIAIGKRNFFCHVVLLGLSKLLPMTPEILHF
jgi:SPP1 gp7 family putative phage head morphogenesis protein